MLFQPLLIGGYLPGFSGRIGRRVHHWIGGALVAAVVIHVGGLWITSPPDMIDALLFASPTPFSPFGVIAMWAIFAVALLAAFRRRLRPRTWRIAHTLLAIVIVVGSAGPRHPDRGDDGDVLEGGALRAGSRGGDKSHERLAGVEKASDAARRERCATVIKLAPLKRRCTNEAVHDARALIDELLTAHPGIAALDFLAHPGNPDRADAARIPMSLRNKSVGGLRLDRLDDLREASCLGLAELLPLDVFPGAAVQAGLVKHEVGFGVGYPRGAGEKKLERTSRRKRRPFERAYRSRDRAHACQWLGRQTANLAIRERQKSPGRCRGF